MSTDSKSVDYLISIRFFAESDKDAWNVRKELQRVICENLVFDYDRRVDISNAETAFMTRRYSNDRV